MRSAFLCRCGSRSTGPALLSPFLAGWGAVLSSGDPHSSNRRWCPGFGLVSRWHSQCGCRRPWRRRRHQKEGIPLRGCRTARAICALRTSDCCLAGARQEACRICRMGCDDHHCHHLLHLRMLVPRWVVQRLLFLMLLLPNASVHSAAIAMVEVEANLMRVSHGSRASTVTQPRFTGATHQQPLLLHTQKGEEAMCNASVLFFRMFVAHARKPTLAVALKLTHSDSQSDRPSCV